MTNFEEISRTLFKDHSSTLLGIATLTDTLMEENTQLKAKLVEVTSQRNAACDHLGKAINAYPSQYEVGAIEMYDFLSDEDETINEEDELVTIDTSDLIKPLLDYGLSFHQINELVELITRVAK